MGAALLGAMVGGLIAVILLSMLFEKVIFSMVFDDPVMGKGFSVLTAWIFASTIWGLNSANWRGFNANGLWLYGVPGFFVLIWYMRQGFRLRGMQEELSGNPLDMDAAKPFD